MMMTPDHRSNQDLSPPPALPPLPLGSTIGILGGGQLGRLLCLAAAKLGMKTHIFCPDPQSPAFEVTPNKTIAAYNDESALTGFAGQVDLVTFEFENVPARTASLIARHVPLAPGADALRICQDRLIEKRFLEETGIALCPFVPVSNLEDLERAMGHIGLPAVLKTTRLGYDGKGQRILKNADQAGAAYLELCAGKNPPPCMVLEAFVPFQKEISVIIARNSSGEIAAYDPAQNVHENHILSTSTLPADIDQKTAREATDIAAKIARALNYRGVLAVEFFVGGEAADQRLLVNEIAPRVHNSGHWTESVCPTSQFEQHIRAICNWPLGNSTRLGDVVMQNLIGDHLNMVPADLPPNAQPNIYGKHTIRAGRKMGHVNHVRPLADPYGPTSR